jgi:hypothetical protein
LSRRSPEGEGVNIRVYTKDWGGAWLG